ncbi:MAG: DUF6048 family protein [Prevotella sp.]|nr:DUF6048 family protein [Prevotella sp.]
MTYRTAISTSIARLALSLLLLVVPAVGHAQLKSMFSLEKDSIPLFRGFSVSFDVLGAAQLALSDYGQYEGALRINLHDQWFPIFELGIGRANHQNDEVTGMTYKTTAPYFRLGMDWNILRNKHQANRLYAGFRYAYTSYKADILRDALTDPIWRTTTDFGVTDMSCYQHWLEIVAGIDAKVVGPLHLGWSVRYRRRVAYDDGDIGTTWYVPGFGIQESTRLGCTFNVIIDI